MLHPRSGGRRLLAVFLGAVLILTGLTATTATTAQAAGDPCGPGGNKIACENSKPGSPPSEWDIDGAGADSIQGFATDISVNVGNPIDFKVDTDARAYTITIYRTGWYGGDGARRITSVTPSASLPQTQPNCMRESATEMVDCGNWGISATWQVPADAVSGVYVALLHRADTNEASHITFIVRDDASRSDVVFQTSDTTWQAYNLYGGSSFYQGGANGRAYKLSYNRPFVTRHSPARDFYFANEFPLVRFLERNGYDVSYIAGVDTDRRGGLLTNHKTFLSVGHDEYWSGAQRANVEAARDAGVNLQFLSGNEVYWRTRYESSQLGESGKRSYRTLVTYKEAWGASDPADESTSTWRDPRYAPKSQGGGLPENALTGTIFMSNNTNLPLTVTREQGKQRLWRDTGLNQMSGATTALAPHTVGYESDEAQDNGFRPPGLIRASETTGFIEGQYMHDFGSSVGDGTTTHSITLYRAQSGALVFGAGTVQWTWGLDATHDSPYNDDATSPAMQQAQINLLADMGAQPTTLMAGMQAVTASTDTTGPTVSISTPAAGSTQANGSKVTLTGTATDTGGVVAGVEYSTDGGTSWHPGKGTSAWTVEYIQPGVGNTSVRVRAVDDSANIGATATRTFNVSCGCSIFGETAIPTTWTAVTGPATPSADDPSAAELGLRFTPLSDGYAAGVRFYKGAGNTGTHTGSLWSTSGERLAQVTFSGETSGGWQQALFTSPVALSAGTTYIVSYTAPNGRYAVQPWAFAAKGMEAYPLEIAGGYGAQPAGVYANPGTFPANSHQNSNYYVDVVFTTTDDSPLSAISPWPLADSSSVPRSTTISARFSKPVVASSVQVSVKDAVGATVPGSTSYDATTRTVTFTPSNTLAGFVKHTVTLAATDTQGTPLTGGKTWSFTTAKPPATPGVCPCSIYNDDDVPTILEDSERASLTLGVRFRPTVTGTVTGVRFYKGVNNTGSHTGTLWSSSGQALAQGTFTGESTSGWQTLTFTQPVAVQAGVDYVASYHTNGSYSATPNAFAASDLSKGPISVSSTAGAYTYGEGFPGNSSASSYMVDLVFQKGAPTLTVTAQSPAPGAVSVPRGTNITVGFSSAITSGYQMNVSGPSGPIAGTSSLNQAGNEITFDPTDLLPSDANVSVSLTGVTSVEGATLAPQSWTFRTRAQSATSQSLFGAQVPQQLAVSDASPVEVGTAFTSARDGQVTAIRFYKGTGNNGTHVGSLWSDSGTRLASVTFVGETASGWQEATLSNPVPVTAGATYVVSYLAPQGHYSGTPGFFNTAWTSGDLTAPATNNGRYLYGAAGGFPTFSYGATNYFVDVVFERAAATMSVTGRDPSPGATGVDTGVDPSITFSAPVANGWSMSATANGSSVAGSAALSSDGRTLQFTPSAALPAGATVSVSASGVVSTDGVSLPTQTWSFTTAAAVVNEVSLFTGVTPQTAATFDLMPIEVGTAFSTSVAGSVTAIRFYKGTGNSGTHTGSLWNSAGTRIAQVTFTNETATGWQTATLPTPVALTPGATYVVSYYAPNGRYASTPAALTQSRTVGPLTAPGGANGRYRYGTGGGLPNRSWNSTNYFVDVRFRPASP
ncbi:Ig-like domain-containing protein [Nocardioides sp. YR527]|nr:Ig-like domain-containing protein [Nocardioides sp. YR527]